MIQFKIVPFVFVLILSLTTVSAVKWDNVAYWDLDQIEDPIKDITENDNDGAIVGNPIKGVEGKINNSVDFNNSRKSNNYVNTTDIDLNGSVSYSLWAFRKYGEDDTTYLSKRDRWGGTTIEIHSNEKSVNFCIRTVSEDSKKGWTPLKQLLNTLSRIFLGKGIQSYTFWGLTELEHKCISAPHPSLNKWHHIIAVYDGPSKNISLYINGEYKSSTNHGSGLPQNNKNYVIGANAMGADGFDGNKGGSEGANGKIDEVGIWNRVLTKQEILELYNSGKGLKYLK